jgi:hypothetical protein
MQLMDPGPSSAASPWHFYRPAPSLGAMQAVNHDPIQLVVQAFRGYYGERRGGALRPGGRRKCMSRGNGAGYKLIAPVCAACPAELQNQRSDNWELDKAMQRQQLATLTDAGICGSAPVHLFQSLPITSNTAFGQRGLLPCCTCPDRRVLTQALPLLLSHAHQSASAGTDRAEPGVAGLGGAPQPATRPHPCLCSRWLRIAAPPPGRVFLNHAAAPLRGFYHAHGKACVLRLELHGFTRFSASRGVRAVYGHLGLHPFLPLCIPHMQGRWTAVPAGVPALHLAPAQLAHVGHPPIRARARISLLHILLHANPHRTLARTRACIPAPHPAPDPCR